MDYEKAYKEALERAKSFQEKYGGDYAGYIFPELRESEDERIRKFLVDYFVSYKIDNVTTKLNGVRIDDILTYLEKQKEQKPAEWDELQAEFRNINEAFEDGRKEVISHPEKYDLCKPAEWSEADEEKLKAICTYLRDYSRLVKLGDKLRFNEYCDFLESLRPQGSKDSLQTHWKPSEEQMSAFKGYIEDFQARAEAAVGGWNNFDVMIRLYEQLKSV